MCQRDLPIFTHRDGFLRINFRPSWRNEYSKAVRIVQLEHWIRQCTKELEVTKRNVDHKEVEKERQRTF